MHIACDGVGIHTYSASCNIISNVCNYTFIWMRWHTDVPRKLPYWYSYTVEAMQGCLASQPIHKIIHNIYTLVLYKSYTKNSLHELKIL